MLCQVKLREARALHYTTHDTRLTHSHRKLRLAEDFEIFASDA